MLSIRVKDAFALFFKCQEGRGLKKGFRAWVRVSDSGFSYLWFRFRV